MYPTLKFNVVDLEYKDIENLTASSIYLYNTTNSGTTQSSMSVVVPNYNKKLLNIVNDDLNGVSYPLTIVLNNDLKFKQEFDIIIYAKDGFYSKNLTINMMYDDGVNGSLETNLISSIDLPIDLSFYDSTAGLKTKNRTYYCSTNVSQYVDSITNTGATNEQTALFTTSNNVFNLSEYVYVNNFVMLGSDSVTLTDYTGLYQISESKQAYIVIDVNTSGMTAQGVPIISFYKGVKIKILRITDVDPATGIDTSTIANRYLIEKTFL